jgi:hypothetical protein
VQQSIVPRIQKPSFDLLNLMREDHDFIKTLIYFVLLNEPLEMTDLQTTIIVSRIAFRMTSIGLHTVVRSSHVCGGAENSYPEEFLKNLKRSERAACESSYVEPNNETTARQGILLKVLKRVNWIVQVLLKN